MRKKTYYTFTIVKPHLILLFSDTTKHEISDSSMQSNMSSVPNSAKKNAIPQNALRWATWEILMLSFVLEQTFSGTVFLTGRFRLCWCVLYRAAGEHTAVTVKYSNRIIFTECGRWCLVLSALWASVHSQVIGAFCGPRGRCRLGPGLLHQQNCPKQTQQHKKGYTHASAPPPYMNRPRTQRTR